MKVRQNQQTFISAPALHNVVVKLMLTSKPPRRPTFADGHPLDESQKQKLLSFSKAVVARYRAAAAFNDVHALYVISTDIYQQADISAASFFALLVNKNEKANICAFINEAHVQ